MEVQAALEFQEAAVEVVAVQVVMQEATVVQV
jgi:hypothetical protein